MFRAPLPGIPCPARLARRLDNSVVGLPPWAGFLSSAGCMPFRLRPYTGQARAAARLESRAINSHGQARAAQAMAGIYAHQHMATNHACAPAWSHLLGKGRTASITARSRRATATPIDARGRLCSSGPDLF